MLNFDFKTNSCFRENCVMWVMNSNYELSQYSINEWKSHPLAHDCFQPYLYLFPHSHCRIKDYNDIWKDLRTLSHRWKRVLLPSLSVFDMGASEAIHSSLNREIISERASPIITMRAQKNEKEREGMRRAHVKDAVAMSETFSYLEERVSQLTRPNYCRLLSIFFFIVQRGWLMDRIIVVDCDWQITLRTSRVPTTFIQDDCCLR